MLDLEKLEAEIHEALTEFSPARIDRLMHTIQMNSGLVYRVKQYGRQVGWNEAQIATATIAYLFLQSERDSNHIAHLLQTAPVRILYPWPGGDSRDIKPTPSSE